MCGGLNSHFVVSSTQSPGVFIPIIKIPVIKGGMTMQYQSLDTGVSKSRGTPKSSILIGFSIINHPFWGNPIFGNTHVRV